MSSLPGAVPPPDFSTIEPPVIPSASAEVSKASPLPLILAAVALVSSGGIAFFLQELGAEWWSLVGYALTPLAAVIFTGWDSSAQLAGQKNPWFVIRPGLSRALRIIAGVSILVGVVHVWRISEWLARAAIQNDWPFFS